MWYLIFFFLTSTVVAFPLYAQESAAVMNDSGKEDEVLANDEITNDAAQESIDGQINDEGYGNQDDEYNEAETNTEIPDEYFNDEPDSSANMLNEEELSNEDGQEPTDVIEPASEETMPSTDNSVQ